MYDRASLAKKKKEMTKLYVTFEKQLLKQLHLQLAHHRDHYAVAVPSARRVTNSNPIKKTVGRRDKRESNLYGLGRYIIGHNWNSITTLPGAREKFELFLNTMINAVETYMPLQKVKLCSTDKQSVTPKIASLVARRQKAVWSHAKKSAMHKDLRNRVQRECKLVKSKYYSNKVSALQ